MFSSVKVDDRLINNTLSEKILNSQYDCSKKSGFFHVSNILDEVGDELYYYDVTFFAGNLTAGDHKELVQLDKEDDDQDGLPWKNFREYINGYGRIIKFKNFAQDVNATIDPFNTNFNKMVSVTEGEFKLGVLNGFGRKFSGDSHSYICEVGFFE